MASGQYAKVNGLHMYYEIHGAGDLTGLPRSQLAVLPGTTHVTLVDRTEWLHSMIGEFLDSP